MDRINGAGHVGRLFVAEDALISRPPTEVTAEWLNAVQEEICSVILAAGIGLSGASNSQLLEALRGAGVFQTQSTNDSSTKVATTAFVNPGSSLAANGYRKTACGDIEQWGVGTVNGSGDLIITFPIAFSVSCFNLLSISGQNLVGAYGYSSITTTGAVIPHYNTATGAKSTGGFSSIWRAIGK